MHVSIKFTPGIDPYVLFLRTLAVSLNFYIIQPIRIENFANFFSLRLGGQNLATAWAIWTTGWAFPHPVNMLEEALTVLTWQWESIHTYLVWFSGAKRRGNLQFIRDFFQNPDDNTAIYFAEFCHL